MNKFLNEIQGKDKQKVDETNKSIKEIQKNIKELKTKNRTVR